MLTLLGLDWRAFLCVCGVALFYSHRRLARRLRAAESRLEWQSGVIEELVPTTPQGPAHPSDQFPLLRVEADPRVLPFGKEA